MLILRHNDASAAMPAAAISLSMTMIHYDPQRGRVTDTDTHADISMYVLGIYVRRCMSRSLSLHTTRT